MCGIAGYTTTKASNYRLKIATAIMAKNMEERGGHSWGYMTENGIASKGLGSIDLGMRIPERMPSSLALHTRYGTTGKNTVDNAHPFHVTGTRGVVVGVHNGIINNHADLNRRYIRNCAVDSQHIFQHIADGISLDDLEGYGAIVYTLNGDWFIGRFNDGEMSVAMTTAGILYASTKDAVMQAASYADVAITKWLKVSNNNVYKLTTAGLTKAYRIDAGRTTRKWNDKQDPFDLLSDRSWLRPSTGGDDYRLQDCDHCGDYVEDVYELAKDFVCATCYYDATNKIPAGYVDPMERSAYSFATKSQVSA